MMTCLSCAPEAPDDDVARTTVEALIAACPLTEVDDEAARDACADKLTGLDVLRDSMADPFRWGGQGAKGDGTLEGSHTTRFNPLVWRRMYLSVFMFPGDYTIEETGNRIVAHVPYELRQLDAGAYPYPFWHKREKWESYEYSTEILFYFEGDSLVGALRSKDQDTSRPNVEREWDGKFQWVDSENREQPHVTLYSYLLSPSNPHTSDLDAAYRDMESKARAHNCTSCHDPQNTADMNPLELFSYPNQALGSRHRIVEQLAQNKMPLGASTPTGFGIEDDAARKELLDAAKEFERLGDLALEFEGE